MSRVTSRMRPRGEPRGFKIVIPVALIVVIVFAAWFLVVPEADVAELDQELCPLSAADIAGHVVVLLDAGKPLGEHVGLPARAIGRVTDAMEGQTELRVMALGSGPTAKLRPLGRLCKPFSNEQLTATAAKDSSRPMRDCNDLPAQLPPDTRTFAVEFCRLRDDLLDRVTTTLASAPAIAKAVKDVHLVEGIEESLLDLANRLRPSLHIFSDMIQHTPWHSHAELVPRDWTMAVLAVARDQPDAPVPVELPTVADLAVTIHYMTRQGLTDNRRNATVHKAFWREYFALTGANLVIEDEPAELAYETVRYGPSAEELAAMEAERLRREREETQRLRDQVAAEAAALEESRRAADQARADAAAAQRAADERAAELGRQAAELQAEAERLAAAQAPEPTQSQAGAAPGPAEAQRAAGAGDEQIALGDSPQAEQPSVPDPPVRTTLEPPAPVGTPEPPPVEDMAVTACAATRIDELPEDLYPQALSSWLRRRGQRVDYGFADIVVDYAIGADGLVTNAAINAKESRAEKPRYLNLFAVVAVDTVADWSFTFDVIDGCEAAQQRSVLLQFRYPGRS